MSVPLLQVDTLYFFFYVLAVCSIQLVKLCLQGGLQWAGQRGEFTF